MGLPSWSRENVFMSNEARRAVVATLIGLAGSPDYRDRADAGPQSGQLRRDARGSQTAAGPRA
jgi:hypothetical protein